MISSSRTGGKVGDAAGRQAHKKVHAPFSLHSWRPAHRQLPREVVDHLDCLLSINCRRAGKGTG
jgi:hypothetical protein